MITLYKALKNNLNSYESIKAFEQIIYFLNEEEKELLAHSLQ